MAELTAQPPMPPSAAVHRWDGIAVEKVTEMISRKVVAGGRQMLAQVYLKRGAHVPQHRHASEQMTYVLQGALRCRVGPDEIVVRAGEVLHIPSGRPHQAEALEDTFEIVVFSPGRDDWLDPPGAEPPAPGTPSGTPRAGTRVSRRCPPPCPCRGGGSPPVGDQWIRSSWSRPPRPG